MAVVPKFRILCKTAQNSHLFSSTFNCQNIKLNYLFFKYESSQQRYFCQRVLRDDEQVNEIQTVRQILDSVTNPNEQVQGKAAPPHCSWKPTSPELLQEAENRIFSRLRMPYKRRKVNIGPIVGSKDCHVWTLSMNEESKATPLVLLHGFGASIGFWALNLETFAKTRPVYAIDILGFGQSSRPKFSRDPSEAESQFIASIEKWREELNMEKFILLGHSFGGFLSFSYALNHPNRLSHLILADPWGFTVKPEKVFQNVPFWVKGIALVLRNFNPFSIIRAAGPMGMSTWKNMVARARPQLMQKFSELNDDDGNGQDIKFSEYVYHCNAQSPPSGESAFHTMMLDYGWAKLPMIKRISNLDPTLDMTAIYGSQSWIPGLPLAVLQHLRRNEGYTNVHVIQGAGHHVYSDGKDAFNKIVLQISSRTDR